MGLHGTSLVQKITTTAQAISAVDPDELRTGQVGKEVGEAVFAQCDICLTALTSALNVDTELSRSVTISLCGPGESQTMTLAGLQVWCRERAAWANEGLYRGRIQRALLQASVWVGDLDEPSVLSEDQAALAAETGRYLLQVLRDAQAAGLSERMQVPWNSTTITLTAATKLGAYVATTDRRRALLLETERTAQEI